MSDTAIKTAQREGQMAEAVKDFVRRNFPEFALTGIDVGPTPKPKDFPSPDELARELVTTLFPELDRDFSPSAMHRRSIATIVAKKWLMKVAEIFEDAIKNGSQQHEKMRAGLELAKTALDSYKVQVADLQSQLRQAIELRGVHADKAKEALQVKLDNAERAHLTDQQLLQTALRELAETRNELVAQQAKYAGLERDHRTLMTATASNAEAPKRADLYLANAVAKCHEFWGENARRLPTGQLVLADLIKARIELQPLTLVAAKPAQEKTG